ncbi:putative homogentisate solanesyltransferase [Helianthus debilis subsp. tardiflorus]
MEPPVAAEVETKAEKTNETEQAKSYDCGLYDTEVVYRIAQELLPGLAEACVDSTTGGIFTSAGSIAVDMRKEMTDYLTQRSETYVAEFLLSENASMSEVSVHPYDIILTLIDDFSSTKRNMFSRVSEWVASDGRDDRIDDFVQEMEINGFWLLARREYVASMLLKNVDYKNAFHCDKVCSNEEELVKHRSECKFRPMDCTNEGCTTRYCAAQKDHHEAVCPFLINPCEQKCSDNVMRREMDRHCVTVCPMKLVHCAFYTVGCQSSIPRCNVQQHNADNLSSHLLFIIRSAHKDASDEDLKRRVEQILSQSNAEKLARARDTRALTYLIKDVEAKLGPLDVITKPHAAESPSVENSKNKESLEPPVVKDGAVPPKKKEENPGSQPARSSTEKPVVTKDDTKQVQPEAPTTADTPVKVEENKAKDESSTSVSQMEEKHQHGESSLNKEEFKDEDSNKAAAKEETAKVKEELSNKDDKETKKSVEEEKTKQLSGSDKEDTMKTPQKETIKDKDSSINDEEEESSKSTEKK